MKSDRLFLRVAGITLILLYLVILAGSVVRATGSGMGCPDWPKCFGHLIPPTDPSELNFHRDQSYSKGEMVIVNDTLWVAQKELSAGADFRSDGAWEKYPTHSYAKFVVSQTWTEYINRLVGAMSSFAMTLLLFLALLRWKNEKTTFFVLLGGMFVLAFVIWLGKVVVDTNLKPLSITLHMMSALALVTVTLFAITRIQEKAGFLQRIEVKKGEFALIISAVIITLLQIVLGTQVRQQIDTINGNMTGMMRETWIEQLNSIYPVHQIAAIALVLVNLFLFFRIRKLKLQDRSKKLLLALLFILLTEYGAGVFIHNFGIPAYAQPVHLVLAMILFGVQTALLLRLRRH
jgi:heme a synthase